MKSSRRAKVFTKPTLRPMFNNYNFISINQSKPARKNRAPAPPKELNARAEIKIKPPDERPPISARRRRENPYLLTPQDQPKYIDHFSTLKRKAENGNYMKESCPICKSKLGSDNLIILSCGHLVHHSCLSCFCRLTKEKVPKCPVCHAVYKIIELHINEKELQKSALIIQKAIRKYLIRKRIPEFAPPGSIMMKKWVVRQAERASSRLTHAMEHQNDCVDAIINSIDHELEWARSIMKSVEIRAHDVDWKSIREKIVERNSFTCTICLREIEEDECEITSCGHCFHESCLSSWMDYCSHQNMQANCPECREFFQHRKLREYRRPVQYANRIDDLLF